MMHVADTLPPSVAVLEVTSDFILARVPVRLPNIDNYQRVLRAKRVAELVRSWQPHRAQTCLLNLREDGNLYVVDGQHRITAMQHLEIRSVLCQIICVPVIEEPAQFIKFNHKNNSPVGTAERFHAALIGQEPWAVAIDAIVQECGFSVHLPKSRGVIQAVDALERIYAHHTETPRPERLRNVLSIVQRGWCSEYGLNEQDQRRCLRSDVLLGLGLLYRSYGLKFDTEIMVKHLKSVSPETFDKRLVSLISVTGIRTRHVATATLFWQIYNFKLISSKRLTLLENVMQRLF